MQQQPMFIKLSQDRVIGLFGNIHEINRLTEEDSKTNKTQISYWVTTASEPYQIQETEFEALMAWATYPSRCIYLNEEDKQRGEYQVYASLGGEMTFEEWMTVFKQHQRLIRELTQVDKPSDVQLEKERQLESALLLDIGK